MTTDEKLKANMYAAKLLKLDPIISVFKEHTVLVGKGQSEHVFNLFTNADYCLTIVKKLGTEHGISIVRYTGQDGPPCWHWNDGYMGGNPHEEYEVAVGQAVAHIMR